MTQICEAVACLGQSGRSVGHRVLAAGRDFGRRLVFRPHPAVKDTFIGSSTIGLALGLMPHALAATPFDGSVPLICTLIEVMDCAPGADCQRGAPESVNLPQFVGVNFTEKTLSTMDAAQRKEATPIKNIGPFDSRLILQGAESGRAWSLIIAKESGKMSATVSDDQVGFVIFGACTPF